MIKRDPSQWILSHNHEIKIIFYQIVFNLGSEALRFCNSTFQYLNHLKQCVFVTAFYEVSFFIISNILGLYLILLLFIHYNYNIYNISSYEYRNYWKW